MPKHTKMRDDNGVVVPYYFEKKQWGETMTPEKTEEHAKIIIDRSEIQKKLENVKSQLLINEQNKQELKLIPLQDAKYNTYYCYFSIDIWDYFFFNCKKIIKKNTGLLLI